MSALLIAGSPSERSRSAALLDAVAQRLSVRGALVDRIHVRDLSPQALLLADFAHPTVARAIDQVAQARVLVVSTPVYKAAYSGVLKVFLDLLPQTALQSLGAKSILPGIYATDAQVALTPEGAYHLGDDIATRLDDAVNVLVTETLRPSPAQATRFAPVPFSQVRCSV